MNQGSPEWWSVAAEARPRARSVLSLSASTADKVIASQRLCKSVSNPKSAARRKQSTLPWQLCALLIPSVALRPFGAATERCLSCTTMIARPRYFIAAATAAMAKVDYRSTDRQSPERACVPGDQPNTPVTRTPTNPRPAVPHAATPNIRVHLREYPARGAQRGYSRLGPGNVHSSL